MSKASPVAIDLAPFRRALRGKKASRPQRIEWVEQNRLYPLNTIDPNDPPDMAAVDLWILAQDDKWWGEVFKNLAPRQQEWEALSSLKDDGRGLPILQAWQEKLDAESTEGPKG